MRHDEQSPNSSENPHIYFELSLSVGTALLLLTFTNLQKQSEMFHAALVINRNRRLVITNTGSSANVMTLTIHLH